MISDKIKMLREQNRLTQSSLAKLLGITRASVNAWEMGISAPSTQYLVELSRIFGVSTDFLLGIDVGNELDVSGLTDEDILLVQRMIAHLKSKNGTQ